MCPLQAISFLSLHASFPSYFDLVEKKTMVTKYATTVNEYRESGIASMHKIHAIVIFVSYMEDRLYKKCDAGQVTT